MNNRIKRKSLVLPIVLLFISLFTVCQQSHQLTEQSLSSEGKQDALPPPVVKETGTGEFTENDLLAVFCLTGKQGSITAYEAAKKVETSSHASGFTFTQKTILAYDDKKGTFKVQVKGSKTESPEKHFEKTFDVSGFIHPYKDASPSSMATFGKKLVFDEALKANLPLDTFITKANAEDGIGYVSFKIQLNNRKEVVFGKYEAYQLTARLEKDKNNPAKVKISGSFKVIAKKYENGVNSSEILADYPLRNIGFPAVEDYFTEQDVFEYIAKELKDKPEFVQADTEAYASAKYAAAMVQNTGGSLLNDSLLDAYKTLYSEASSSTHLKIEDITAAVDNVRNGGIRPNDYTGELEVSFYITRNEYIGEGNNPTDKQKSESYSAKATGFKKLPKDIPNDILTNSHPFLPFSIAKHAGDGGTQATWSAASIPSASLISQNTGSVSINYDNWFNVDNTAKTNNIGGYYLKLNNKSYTDCVPSISTNFLLRDKPDSSGLPNILIKELRIAKNENEEDITLFIQFLGKDDIQKVSLKPKIY